MQQNETYDEWHRREYPSQYIWENFKYPEFGVSDDQLVCKIDIRIFNCEGCQLVIDNDFISEKHILTIENLISNQESFIEDIRNQIFEYYTFLWNDYLKDFEDEIKYPNPNSNNNLIIDAMIKPYSIHLASKIKEGYFGICFITTFEDEHGLGAEFRDYKIKNVGGSDVGFSLYPDE